MNTTTISASQVTELMRLTLKKTNQANKEKKGDQRSVRFTETIEARLDEAMTATGMDRTYLVCECIDFALAQVVLKTLAELEDQLSGIDQSKKEWLRRQQQKPVSKLPEDAIPDLSLEAHEEDQSTPRKPKPEKGSR